MMQKDYILRIIEQTTKILARIIFLREIKDYEGALAFIDEVYRQALSFGADLIHSVPDETLLSMLTSFDTLDVEKCLLVAKLLKAEGDISLDQGDVNTAYYRHLKSLYLFLEVFLLSNSSVNDPDLVIEIEEVLQKLEEYELPVEIKSKLFRYFERTGRYAQAEDVLFEMIEADNSETENDLLAQGIAFYCRLLKKKDHELNAGGLPRDEVETGLFELQNRLSR